MKLLTLFVTSAAALAVMGFSTASARDRHGHGGHHRGHHGGSHHRGGGHHGEGHHDGYRGHDGGGGYHGGGHFGGRHSYRGGHYYGGHGGHHHGFGAGLGWLGYPSYRTYVYRSYEDASLNRSGSDDVAAAVQESLARRGYYEGEIDGLIGPGTRSAIRNFQEDEGLAPSGRITNSLLDRLGLD